MDSAAGAPFFEGQTPFRRTNTFSRGKRYNMVRADCWQWQQLLGGQVYAVAYSCVCDRAPWSHILSSRTIPLPLQPHHSEKSNPSLFRQTKGHPRYVEGHKMKLSVSDYDPMESGNSVCFGEARLSLPRHHWWLENSRCTKHT